MKLRRSRITLAVAAALALGAGSTLPVTASASAALDATTAEWATDGELGNVLLFPYYTVRDNPKTGTPYRTSFTVTNTGEDVVILKFRLRDHKNSQDVLDFMWAMSPKDEVVAYMDRAANGQPRVNFPKDEKSCRIPWLGGQSTFTAPGGTVSVADAQEGHLEIIPMMTLDPASTYGKVVVHGSGQDCDVISNLFLNNSGDDIETALDTSKPDVVENVLRGSYSITSTGGFSGGGRALAVANWALGDQPFFYGQNPLTTDATQLNGKDTREWDHPHLGDSADTASIDASVIGAQSVINNWSTNPSNGVGVDWVVTYFTKYLFQDSNGFYGPATGYAWPVDPNPNVIYDTGVLGSPWTTPWSGDGGECITIDLDDSQVYDREENTLELLLGGISPGPDLPTIDICNEANVIAVSQNGFREEVLRGNDAIVLDVTGLPLPYGWADVTVNPALMQTMTAIDTISPDPAPVAVGGFSFTVRDLGDPTTAYGAIHAHDLVLPVVPEPE